MMIHTLVILVTLLDQVHKVSVELDQHLDVDHTLAKFVPDDDHTSDRATRLPQRPFRSPWLTLLLLLLLYPLIAPTLTLTILRRFSRRELFVNNH